MFKLDSKWRPDLKKPAEAAQNYTCVLSKISSVSAQYSLEKYWQANTQNHPPRKTSQAAEKEKRFTVQSYCVP